MMLSKCWYWLVLAVVMWASLVVADRQKQQQQQQQQQQQHHHHTRTTTDDSKQLVQQLESSLLSSFGLKKRPQVKMGTTVPPYMLELFHKYQQDLKTNNNDDDNDVKFGLNELLSDPSSASKSWTSTYNTVRSFSHEETKADIRYPAHKMRLRFSVAHVPKDEILHSAELRITHLKHPDALAQHHSSNTTPPPPHTTHTNSTTDTNRWKQRRWRSEASPYMKRIKVYDIMRPASRHSEPALRLLDTSVVDAREKGVQTMDVSDAVRRWMMSSKSNNGLLVEIVSFNQTSPLKDPSHVRLRRSPEEESVWSEQQPLLVVYTNDGKPKRRSKRSAVNKHKKTRETCRRHRLHVNFRQVGWDDWILAPSGYDAYFCKGECHFPIPDNLNTTNHAVVQTLVNSRYPDRVPKACCVPTELSPISMLYQDDDDQFVLKNHQDMVVEGCGCR